MQKKTFYRQGPDHRQGESVDFVHIRRRFDFRSIQLGRWVTLAEREQAAGLFYDALCDLMLILQGPELLISLRGSLALMYGTGGRPGVAAHYDPAQRAFALAKNAGPGSIAHEWFHALDHYLAQKVFMDAPPGLFASSAWLEDATPRAHPLNDLLVRCLQTILLSPDGRESSELFRRSAEMDRRLGVTYYSRPEELCARAFEAFIQDGRIKNRFLVSGTLESPEAKAGLYPQGEQRALVNMTFGEYFRSLGRTLVKLSC